MLQLIDINYVTHSLSQKQQLYLSVIPMIKNDFKSVPAQKKHLPSALNLSDAPAIVGEILELQNHNENLRQSVDLLIEKYPQFFQRIIGILNSTHFNLAGRVSHIYQAITLVGLEPVRQLALIQVVYRTLNQYKILGIDRPAFWQDVLHRAVCAKKIASLTGQNELECFNAGFMQDIGLFLLFLESPAKGVLWSEFRKREPQARLSMELRVFNQQHDHRLKQLMQDWNMFPEMHRYLAHHQCSTAELAKTDNLLCSVLHCADWLAAVYSAEDKNYVLDRCRKILMNDFNLASSEMEKILETVPDEVDICAQNFGIEINSCVDFSKIIYAANVSLNEHNSRFQEVASRLEQALKERDKLAQEIQRDLTLAREIQQSLLPESRGKNYPLHGINISAKILSGDFYDFFERENGDTYFNLGDVSGKGVNAALLMAKTCSLFRCLGKRIDDPGILLSEINNELCETSIHGMFVTMVAGLYCPSTNTLRLVNAGNPPALLFMETGICQEFEATAPPLGIMPDTTYFEYNINLGKGSLYMYSDGVTEGYINDEEMLELSGLFKLISAMQSGDLPEERLNEIINVIMKSAIALRDDVTLLLLEAAQEDD